MPSPFPGMDPYIEATGLWSTFHHSFLGYCQAQLNERLPKNYAATIEERVLMIEEDENAQRRAEPDVGIIFTPGAFPSPLPVHKSSVATITPRRLRQETEYLDIPKQSFIQILHLPDQRLVTDLELLSPTNKTYGGKDRIAFLARRRDLLRHDVNVVEIDLLLGGERLPMKMPLPDGDYYVFVTRSLTWSHCDVYGWPLRDQLPTIPIPLRVEDGDVGLDLASVFKTVYDTSRFDKLLRYNEEPPLLSPSNREWAIERLRSRSQ